MKNINKKNGGNKLVIDRINKNSLSLLQRFPST